MTSLSWQSLRRNWHVGIIGLAVTGSLVVAAATLYPVNYVATSQIVLLPPLSQPNASYNGVVNPYMGLAGLQSMAAVVSSAMMDDETATSLEAAGVTSYNVTYDAISAGPILIAQATDRSPAQASRAISALDKQVPITVARLQKEASISPSSFISAKVIAGPSAPVKSTKTQLRIEVLALVVGLILTLLVISIIDGWRVKRNTGSRGRATGAPEVAEAPGRSDREPEVSTEQSSGVTPPLSSDNFGYQARSLS